MVRHRIANPTLRKGRVGSTPTLSARLRPLIQLDRKQVFET